MMAHYPRSVYVIVPLTEEGSYAGVYVGSAYRVKERINQHLYDYCADQWELHDLMRRNGFRYAVIDTIRNIHENHFEYDWMDFFKQVFDVKLFNKRQSRYAHWENLKGHSMCDEFLRGAS